ncbi:hypothetical protein AB6D20_027485 (plasmid) [Vibrio splendidus]
MSNKDITYKDITSLLTYNTLLTYNMAEVMAEVTTMINYDEQNPIDIWQCSEQNPIDIWQCSTIER